jgi:plasmid maintenance system antidote protein VapI
MRVQEKTRLIDVTITGLGLGQIKGEDEDDDVAVAWESTDLYKEIMANETPGLSLQAYRARAGLSIVQLAEKTGIKYTHIAAMEQDLRAISARTARRFAVALGCDYNRILCVDKNHDSSSKNAG